MEESQRPIRLMSFVSEEQLDEAKKTRGERVEDGTAQRDRPLYEILKENKDKKDAEFNERFKHRPPKALDEDETEFLDKLETSKRKYERQVADEETEQLRKFQEAVAAKSAVVHELKETTPVPAVQEAVAAKSAVVHELKETTPVPAVQEKKATGKKNPPSRPLNMIVKVKPQVKKARIDQDGVEESSETTKTSPDSNGNSDKSKNVAMSSLVSYSDESEEDA